MSHSLLSTFLLPTHCLLHLPCVQTQFEAFLSMRQVTAKGLGFASESERRCSIEPIHNAPRSIAQVLIDEWGVKTAREATMCSRGKMSR